MPPKNTAGKNRYMEDNTNNPKIIGLLTICRKAGRLTVGFDMSVEAIKKGKAELVILASDISPKTEKEIRFFAAKKNTAVLKSDMTMEELGSVQGRKTGIAAVCDKGFAARFTELIRP